MTQDEKREDLALALQSAHTLAVPHEKGTLEDVRDRYYRIQHSELGRGMNQQEIWHLSCYSIMMDVNPFRGEVYTVRGKDGKIHIVDGYKALTRWARNSCEYTDNYEALPLGDGERWRIRCTIMRRDRLPMIEEYKGMGATFKEAFDAVATVAVGVVRESETVKHDGTAIDPPKGWTWEHRARIRALKNALNLSHGAPSPREMAEASYTINGTATVLEDWEGTEELKYPEEREKLAELRAQGRKHRENWETLTPEQHQEKLRENVDMMRAPADFEGYGDEPKPTQAEHVAQTLMEDDLATAKQPAPGTQDAPASQHRAKLDNDVGEEWRQAVVEIIESTGAYYVTKKDGEPDWNRLTGAAFKMGYPTISRGNLQDVIENVVLYAEDQQAQTTENEGPPDGDEVQKALL